MGAAKLFLQPENEIIQISEIASNYSKLVFQCEQNHSFFEENELSSRCPGFEYFVGESWKKSAACFEECNSFPSAAFASAAAQTRLEERLQKG